MKFTCIDGFCGAGGLSIGLQKAGFDVLFSFDNDARCIETQKLNKKYFKRPAELNKIEDLLGGKLLKKAGIKKGELFLLAGGPPCQGFSIQRIGSDSDFRNELILKYIKLVGEVMPKYFIMENVRGITGIRGRAILDKAKKEADKIGYWIHESILDAQDYGVPQRRKRVFLVGERKDLGPAKFSFPDKFRGKKKTVRDAIGHLPSPPSDGSDHPDYIHHRQDRLSDLNKKRLLNLKPGQGRDYLPKELLADCHRIDSNTIGHRNVYGRMKWDDVSPTITARFDSFTRGMFGHPNQTRTITLREGALLQTFQEDFVFKGNKVDIAKQIGNAVPPVLAEILGKQIIKCYENK